MNLFIKLLLKMNIDTHSIFDPTMNIQLYQILLLIPILISFLNIDEKYYLINSIIFSYIYIAI